MAKSLDRFKWVTFVARVWGIGVLIVLGIILIAATTILTMSRDMGMGVLVPWIAAAAVAVILVAGVLLVYGLAQTLVSNESEVRSVNDRMQRLESLTEALYDSSKRLVDLEQMSDAAKSLLFRQREIEAMFEMLHEEIINQRYDRATELANDVEKRFGYAQEVQLMRKEIAEAQKTTMDQKISSAIDRIHRLVSEHDWTQAIRQTRRLTQLMPDNAKINALPEMVRIAHAAHKRGLLEAYGEAVKAGDVDKSVQLLHELDKYLTPQEAAAYEESARGVLKARLHNLGVQFSIRVAEEQWADAAAIGETIMTESPNSKFAQEVRLKMDTLRSLAEQKSAGE
jgi:hypothetical protein